MDDNLSHQRWLNFKASEYVREIDEVSHKLRDLISDGTKLSQIDRDHALLLSERIAKIAGEPNG